MWDFEIGRAGAGKGGPMSGARRGFAALALGLALLLQVGLARSQSTGSIEGGIGFPSEEVPAMHVYAIPADGGPAHRIDTEAGQLRFEIPGLPAGSYHVIAYPVGIGSDGSLVGAWTDYVTCGMTASCLQHQLLPVAVSAGKATAGVRVEDWYASADSFPPESALGKP
jgi:hypothetical protein